MIVPIVDVPVRHAQPSPKGRSASCSADARTRAPSHTAARTNRPIPINRSTTAAATIKPMWPAIQPAICCWIAVTFGALLPRVWNGADVL